jgi:hypothetical protein
MIEGRGTPVADTELPANTIFGIAFSGLTKYRRPGPSLKLLYFLFCFFENALYSANYARRSTENKCRVAGNLPLALLGALKPSYTAWGVRRNAAFTHILVLG